MSKQWSVSRHGWILRLTVIRALSFSVHQQCLPLEWLYSWADHLLHTMVPGSSRVISSLHLMALSKCSPLTSMFCTRTLGLICHMAISEPVIMSRRLGSYTHLESGGWLLHLEEGWLPPERFCYQKRGDGIKEGEVRGSPFDLYYIYFISNKEYFICTVWVVTFEWAHTHNIYMSFPKD